MDTEIGTRICGIGERANRILGRRLTIVPVCLWLGWRRGVVVLATPARQKLSDDYIALERELGAVSIRLSRTSANAGYGGDDSGR